MDWISNPQIWIAFFTLVVLELVLGVDNVIFISILAGKLPAEQQPPHTPALSFLDNWSHRAVVFLSVVSYFWP
jgi:hypothetical protein